MTWRSARHGTQAEPTRDDVIAATEPTRAQVAAAELVAQLELPLDEEPLRLEVLDRLEPGPGIASTRADVDAERWGRAG